MVKGRKTKKLKFTRLEENWGEQQDESGKEQMISRDIVMMNSSSNATKLPTTGRKRVRTSTKNYSITDYFGSSPRAKGAKMDAEWGSNSDQEDFADLVEEMRASVDGLARRPSLEDGQGADQPKDDGFEDSLELENCQEFDIIVRNHVEQKMEKLVPRAD